MQSIFNLGLDFIVELQSVGKWPTFPMEAFSFLGTEMFYLITLPLLYWCVDSALGLRVAAILMISGAVNNALKLTCQGPRPYWISTQVDRPGSRALLWGPIRPCPKRRRLLGYARGSAA